jgi:hypothetical protein
VFEKIIMSTVVLTTLITSTMLSAWEASVDKDVMSGEKTCYVVGKWTKSMERMAFPYQGTKQAIGVGVKKDSVYVYFAHNIQPNLTDDKVEDGFSEATRRVKFDDNVEEYRQTQDFGSAYIHIANYYDEYNSETSSFDNTNKNDLEFIQKLKNSKSLTTELA